jgi:predicted nucleic acid-binding protein
MKTLIDTNILVYAHDSTSSYQKAAAQLLARVLQGRLEAVVSVQNIAELYSVLTSSRRTGRPLQPRDARQICKLYLAASEIPKLVPDGKAFDRGLELASEHKVTGGDFFDCLLAATMELAGVTRIYTENITDFKRFRFLETIFPLKKSES